METKAFAINRDFRKDRREVWKQRDCNNFPSEARFICGDFMADFRETVESLEYIFFRIFIKINKLINIKYLLKLIHIYIFIH